MLNYRSPADIEKQRDEEYEAAHPKPVHHEDAIAAYVRSCWQVAKSHRSRHTERFQDCLRRRQGVYSPEKLEKIRENRSSTIYMRIVSSKCKAAKSWIIDLFSPAGDRPFTLTPKSRPEMPPDMAAAMVAEAMSVMSQSELSKEQAIAVLEKHRDEIEKELALEAEVRAEKMSAEIEDMLNDAGWKSEFNDFVDDLVTYPVAILSGLEFRETSELTWAMNDAGHWAPTYAPRITPKIRRVSPFRFYPSPSVTTSLDGHWCIEHISYTRSDLASMRNAPGYRAQGIAMALTQYSAGGLREWLWDEEERTLAGSMYHSTTETIDALRWSGSMSGSRLIDYGLPIGDPISEHQVTIEIVGGFVIRAALSPDPDASPDYFHAAWSSVPGSFYGDALPELMADCEDTCNACARALHDNMAMSSGPMVWVNTALMADGADYSTLYPRKIFRAATLEQGTRRGIEFFQPASNANELLNIFERFSNLADEVTGLPKFAYGSDRGAGAAKTASGLSMLMNASSKTIKHVVRSIDRCVEKLVKKTFDHVMMYGDNPEIKGDCAIRAKGSESLIHKEQSVMRQQELLGITSNPYDMQIIGQAGRLAQLREVFKVGDVPTDKILPTREELEERQAAMVAQQGAEQAAGQPAV